MARSDVPVFSHCEEAFFADVAIHGLGVVGQQWIATPFGFAMTVFETGFSPG